MTKKEQLREIILAKLNGEDPRKGLDGVDVKFIQRSLMNEFNIKFSSATIITVLKGLIETEWNKPEQNGYPTCDGDFTYSLSDAQNREMSGNEKAPFKYYFFFT